MAVVSLTQITKQFGPHIVLEDCSFDLHPGETVGLVGTNGAGKTTLFRVIAGELEPDMGAVSRSRSLEIGYLKQEPEILADRPMRDEVGSAFADLLDMEHRLHQLSEEIAARSDDPALPELLRRYDSLHERFIAAGGHTFEARIDEIIGGLGFTQADRALPMSKLSGGQRCRVSLAKVLLRDAELLLLDEPTNHLDIDAVRWLERFLASHRGGAVVISHDRYLLDRVSDRVVEMADRTVTSYPGNYTNYVHVKALRQLTQERQFAKDQAFLAKERAFIDKHMAGQRTKEAKGRRARLERRMAAGEFVTETEKSKRTAKIRFQNTDMRGGSVLRLEELAMHFGEKRLFEDVSFEVLSGQRIGITGPNGTGKSTLLKIVLGQLDAAGGSAWLDPKRTVGYYAQEPAALDPERTVLEEIRSACPDLTELAARTFLGSFLFSGDDVFKVLGNLSGGEQSRVRLATLILKCPDLLILDEPTNHLDIPSREALEDALTNFPGTVLVVSHDRYFLDRVVERLLVIRPEGHKLYEGNYTFYIEKIEQQRAAQEQAAASAAAAQRAKAKKQRAAEESAKPKRRTAQYDHMSVDAIEEMMIEREERLAALGERFGDPEICKNPDALADLQDEIHAIEQEVALLDEAWHERADDQ